MCMRKFAISSFVACVAGFFVAQGFAQPRDLFAEFEAETAAQEAESSSSVVPASSSVQAQPKAPVASSSSVAVSSSSVAVSSSSMTEEEQYAAQAAAAYAEKEAAIRRSIEAAQAAEEARREAIPEDSTLAVEDSIMRAQDSLFSEQEMAMPVISSSSSESADSAQVAAASSSSDASAVPSSSSMSRRDLLGPVKVSKVNGMDEIKGKYKDPRKALFMSLVIPGSGQLYIGGSTFNNIRGGVYLALEAGLWTGWYYYSVHKYGKQVKRYKSFAKKNYSIGNYENGMRDLYNAGANGEFGKIFRTRYLGSRESFCEAIYGNAKSRGCYVPDAENLYKGDESFKNDFVNNPVNLGKEMDVVKFDNPDEIYSLIASDAFVLGWNDVDDKQPASALNLNDPDAATVTLGKSKNLREYRSLRNKANGYADMQAWFFGGLILNHIISAVDAALTANAHNKTLYQEDLSWYDHLRLDGGFSFVENGFGLNVMAGWSF